MMAHNTNPNPSFGKKLTQTLFRNPFQSKKQEKASTSRASLTKIPNPNSFQPIKKEPAMPFNPNITPATVQQGKKIPGIEYVKKQSFDDSLLSANTPNPNEVAESRLESVLPSPYDFLQKRPTPIEKMEDVAQLQEALLESPFEFDYNNKNTTTSIPSNSATPQIKIERSVIDVLCEEFRNAQNIHAKATIPVEGNLPPRGTLVTEGMRNLNGSPPPMGSLNLNNSSPSSVDSAKKKCAYKRKKCTVEGCKNLSRSKGLCKAHGGGRRCSVDGCNRASQSGSLCITHGGGKRCNVDGCTKAAQSRGMCKGHGGGVRCKVDGCRKSSQGDGLCRTHGGGRRCCHPSGCGKWAQRNGMCMVHSEGKYGNSYRGRMQRLEVKK